MDFTQRSLDKLSEPGNYWAPDTPGLVLRVYPSGTKAWWFSYRMGGRASKKRWLKIGNFNALPLNRVRKTAEEYHVQVGKGIDPGKALQEAAAVGATIFDLWNRYLDTPHFKKRAPKTQAEYLLSYKTHILPKLGGALAAELTREQVEMWHARIEAPIAANRALAVLSKLMTLAIEVWGIRKLAHPCKKVERNPEAPRLRDITPAELAALGQALKVLEGQHSSYALAAIRVILLCWGRVSEVLGLRRDRDVFLEEGYSLVRDHKAVRKMGPKRLELPPQAIRILKALPQEKDNPWYFPGRRPGRPLTRMGLYHTWLAVCREAGVSELHLHDSRSLAASEAEAQGVNTKTAAAVLGHLDPRTTEKHYARVRKAKQAAIKIATPIADALEGKVKRRPKS